MNFVPALYRAHGAVLPIGPDPSAATMVSRSVGIGERVRRSSQNIDVAKEICLGGHADQVELSFREPRALDFEEAAAVIATIGEPLAHRTSEQARAAGLPIDVIGRPDLSTLVPNYEDDAGPDDGCDAPPRSVLRRLTAWLSAYLSCPMRYLGQSLPSSFGI